MTKTPEELAEEYAKYHYDVHGDRVLAKIDFLAGYQAAAPQWISVKDRLPEIDEEVIVAVPFVFEDESGPTKEKGCWIKTARLMSEPEGAKWSIHIEEKWITHITHWMPLPQPPKED